MQLQCNYIQLFNLCYTLCMFQQLRLLFCTCQFWWSTIGTDTFWIYMHLIATINLSWQISISKNITNDYKVLIRVICITCPKLLNTMVRFVITNLNAALCEWTIKQSHLLAQNCVPRSYTTSHIVPGHNFVHEISSVVTGIGWNVSCTSTACKWPYIRSTPALYEI